MLFHIATNLFVLVLAVRSLSQILLETLNTLAALKLGHHLVLLETVLVNRLKIWATLLTGRLRQRECVAQFGHRSHSFQDSLEVSDHVGKRLLHLFTLLHW